MREIRQFSARITQSPEGWSTGDSRGLGGGDRYLLEALLEAGLNVKTVEMKRGRKIVIVERAFGIETPENAEYAGPVLDTAGTTVQEEAEYTVLRRVQADK
jgi:hypothetical protein